MHICVNCLQFLLQNVKIQSNTGCWLAVYKGHFHKFHIFFLCSMGFSFPQSFALWFVAHKNAMMIEDLLNKWAVSNKIDYDHNFLMLNLMFEFFFHKYIYIFKFSRVAKHQISVRWITKQQQQHQKNAVGFVFTACEKMNCFTCVHQCILYNKNCFIIESISSKRDVT